MPRRHPELPEPLRVVIDTSAALPVLTSEDVDNHWLVLLWQSNAIIPMVNSETIEELKAQIIEHSPTAKELQARRFLIKTMSPIRKAKFDYCRRAKNHVTSLGARPCHLPRRRTLPNAGTPVIKCSLTLQSQVKQSYYSPEIAIF